MSKKFINCKKCQSRPTLKEFCPPCERELSEMYAIRVAEPVEPDNDDQLKFQAETITNYETRFNELMNKYNMLRSASQDVLKNEKTLQDENFKLKQENNQLQTDITVLLKEMKKQVEIKTEINTTNQLRPDNLAADINKLEKKILDLEQAKPKEPAVEPRINELAKPKKVAKKKTVKAAAV